MPQNGEQTSTRLRGYHPPMTSNFGACNCAAVACQCGRHRLGAIGVAGCLLAACCSCALADTESRKSLAGLECPFHEVPSRTSGKGGPPQATLVVDPAEFVTASPCYSEASEFTIRSLGTAGEMWRLAVVSSDRQDAVRLSVTSPTSGVEFWSQRGDGRARAAEIGLVTDGDAYEVRVEFFSQLGVKPTSTYMIALERTPLGTDECCSMGPGPGCVDADILTCVCRFDNSCCLGEYDAVCVAEAKGVCDLRCGDSVEQKDCCHPSASGGCTATKVEECVCDIDPYCCVGAFDHHCVALSVGRCRGSCEPFTGSKP